MKLIGQAAAKLHPRLALRGCALLCILALSAAAQTSPVPPARPTGSSENASAQAGFQGILNLDGPWRFHSGDDPRWAAPDLDDSSWPLVVLGQPLSDQIVDPYTRYGWYRLRLDSRQLAAVGDASSAGPLQLLIASHALSQLSVWIDGVEAGSTRGMTARPAL